MSIQENEDKKAREKMQEIGKLVDANLPVAWGFVVLAFPTGEGGRMNYISNCQRTDVVRVMYEFIEASKGQWGEHEPDQSEAAQDSELGRLRQRVAELERQLSPESPS